MKKYTLLFLLLLSISYPATTQIKETKEIKRPTVEYRHGIYYLELDGNTAYERGFQDGTALKFVIKKSSKNF
jgi:isopenicillin-N N-acyltransferase-like protein